MAPPSSPWLSLMQAGTNAWTIALTSQQVIWSRMALLATGGLSARNQRESTTMVTEKIAAATEASTVWADWYTRMLTSWPTMWTSPKTADRVVGQTAQTLNRSLVPYAKRVRSNATRLQQTARKG